jgi:M6 family metalloprotease-like protein
MQLKTKGGRAMKGPKIFSLLLPFLILALSADVQAVSPSPELVEKLKREGRFEEVMAQLKAAREEGWWQPSPNPPLRRERKAVQVDTLKAVVLLVDFDDNVSTHRPGEFDTLLFTKGFVYPTGSMRDFYWENSYETFEVMGAAHGWFRMPRSYVSYACTLESCYGRGTYPYNSRGLVEDAINAADPYVNFADYDHDGDGWVDALFVVHAGPGAEQTGQCCHIWSHKSHTSSPMLKDGVYLYDYAMEPETRSIGLVDIGVFCHEFGHVLGILDLYDTDGTSEGLGEWSLMASGSWNDDGRSPAHFDAWCKNTLGFTEVVRLTANQVDFEILQAETTPVSYRLWTSGQWGSEYYLVENRQKTGFDAALPGEGLLIYHVDENMSNNTAEWCPGDPPTPHFKVALEQADGRFQLEGCYGFGMNRGDAGDPYPGSTNMRAFDDTTTPSSRDYYDDATQVAVWNISDPDSAMYANLDIVWSRPCLHLVDTTLDDLLGGDGDGRPEAGETVTLYFAVSNIWLPVGNTSVTVSADTAGIVFTDDYSYLGYVGTGDTLDNASDPMEFEVDSLFPGRPTIFTLHVEGDTGTGTYTFDLEVEIWAGNAVILIVDDAGNYQSYYADALDSLRTIYDIWDAYSKGDPDFSFSDYKYLIWYTGDHRSDVFTSVQVESLMSFLDNGGGLFMTSQDAAEALTNSGDPLDSIFLTDYLHCSLDDGSVMERQAMGVDGDTIGDGWYMYLWGIPSPQNQTSKDALVPDDSADTVLNYAGSGWVRTDLVAALRFQGDYKLVFFGFGFEGMNTAEEFQGQPLARPHVVMQTVLDWFRPFICGDCNADGVVDVGDLICLINYLFTGTSAPEFLCIDDVNCDGVVNSGDVIYLINYLFTATSPPCSDCCSPPW